ncbi:ATP-binding protein, partial [Candidatus Woesearchaeota archaeon]|nr:ATP-binding protein [Candidatus Woesearchaeota archaeon]
KRYVKFKDAGIEKVLKKELKKNKGFFEFVAISEQFPWSEDAYVGCTECPVSSHICANPSLETEGWACPFYNGYKQNCVHPKTCLHNTNSDHFLNFYSSIDGGSIARYGNVAGQINEKMKGTDAQWAYAEFEDDGKKVVLVELVTDKEVTEIIRKREDEKKKESKLKHLKSGLEIVVLVGIAACGKSTYTKNNYPNHYRINLDSIHQMLDSEKGFDNKNRDLARKIENEIITDRLKQKIPIIIDNTNLDQQIRAKYVELSKEHDVCIKAVYFEPDVKRSIKQNKERKEKGGRFVPEPAIYSQAKKITKPTTDEGFDEIIEAK